MRLNSLGLRDGENKSFGSRILGIWSLFARREVAFLLRSVFRPANVDMLGLKLPAHHALISNAVRRSIYRDNYERPELAAIVRNLRADDRVLECGAGIGAISAACATIVGGDAVVAVEADPRMRDVIERTWALNGVSPTLLTGFVTDVAGEEEISVDDNLVSTGRARADGKGERRMVPRLPLGDLITQYRPSVIVMDVEGAEVELLTLEALVSVRMICVEVHPHLIGNDRCLDLIVRLREIGLNLLLDESAYRCLVFRRD